ncbi:cellulase family glycosylhydrolase [Amycolatopsis sp. SID8362]|uniref:cellulase family glycosylhydrolase n=1 Tax=Amycolatopsis sp. SID8362 TaxID=2690346 RepID=UPI00136AFEB5|nr:cellulase family glycosylhydrolase [Amycolatopsis sp. SID8362]NBH06602.1 cellulase family glycosylhydrolase [Amycolatopsis sp. SID8362]NED43299.1 cellulase family glycosylhydrolase [Amycolatopsis sp. SID8362]
MKWRFLRTAVAGLLLAACAVVAPAPAHAATPTRVMALGDSITGSPGCWRALLWRHLQETGHTDVDFVGTLPPQGCGFTYDGENEGHGGFLATGIARDNQLPGWLSSTHPDVVLMHLGTNDVWNGIAPGTILDAFTTLLGQMRASNPATKLIVAKIIPMNPSNCAACAQRVVDLNAAIPGWAAAHSTAASPITVVDQWTGFDTAADTTDGVHPNGTTGIAKMESKWYPALVAALSPSTPAATGLHVDGTRVAEANGAAFVMRGVNHPYAWYTGQNSAFANIKSFGANTVRVVLGSGKRWGPTSAAEVTNIIGLCKQSRLICVLEVHDTTGYGEESAAASLDQAADYWISIANALKGQENYVVINLGNEPFGNNQQVSATWASATSSAITRLRGAGLQHLIMADAPMWGQDWQNIMRDNAASVLSADPQHNTVFSIHMYGVYDTAAEINAYFDAFRTAGLPLVVGEFGNMHSDGDPDEDTIMAQAQARGLGYLGWSWSGNGSDVAYLDMTNGFDPTSLTAWGERFLNGANGVRQTSKEATIYGGGTVDTQAPTTPGTPAVSGVTSSGVTLSWTASTDDVGVTGYDVLRAPGASGGTFAVVGSSGTTTFTDSGLSASSTYRYQVRAKDAAGNTSAASGAVTATTSAGGGTGACKVAYSAPGWGGGNGFTASVTITNTGTSTLTGWTLAFTYTAGQKVTLPGWGATFTQSGSGAVTATNLAWNGTLAPNAATGIGFNGTYTGSNPAPASFSLNGSTCTIG